jgi:uncharacterized protein
MEEKIKKISFRQKNPTTCPVCGESFHKEDMLTGGGRIIAGNITTELRREYKESKKYGIIYPMAYVLTVCPVCLYTAFPKDFETLDPDAQIKLSDSTPARKASVSKFFGNLDMDGEKNLPFAAASYMLSIDCYSVRPKNIAPTFKMAVSAIRAAWLFDDMAKAYPDKPYKKISVFFYKKAYIYYTKVVELIQNGLEPSDKAGNMGPDTDKNWGYEGILYMTAVLTLKVGSREPDINKRIAQYELCKSYLSRLFGMGKADKSRPGELLDRTRDMFEKINTSLNGWIAERDGTPSEE